MKLYLVQHAKAAPEEIDPQRLLTEEGRSDTQRVAAFIKPLNLRVDYLWHSRKKRAVQTAELLAEVIRVDKGRIERDGLGPNDDVAALKDKLISSRRDVMIVGHMPFLAKLASLLLSGYESADTVVFKNAGIICLNYSDDKQWQIEWMVTPQLLA